MPVLSHLLVEGHQAAAVQAPLYEHDCICLRALVLDTPDGDGLTTGHAVHQQVACSTKPIQPSVSARYGYGYSYRYGFTSHTVACLILRLTVMALTSRQGQVLAITVTGSQLNIFQTFVVTFFRHSQLFYFPLSF